VIGVIYEGRPNVTTDAAALALKSGNAIVLRGSRIAERSNAILGDVVAAALAGQGLPEGTITMLGTDRDEMLEMRNLGDTTLQEIEEKLRELGMHLGMDVPAGAAS
jgi:gamma-glutamyl phosphate reductase